MIEFLQQYFSSIVVALAIMSTAFLIFWYAFGKKLANRKIQLSRRAGWPQIKEEIGATFLSFIGSTLFMVLLLSLKDKGITHFFNEPAKYGLCYEVMLVVLMLLISDTWFYWSHRIMHHPKLYKYVHALHHKSLDVNPYTSTSFHVIESVWLTVWVLPLSLVMPISMTALGVMQVLGTFNNLKSHLGYELFPNFLSKAPFNFLVTATNHSLHHTQYNGNYGLFFRFWDVVCGTELNTTTTLFKEIHQRKNEIIIDNTHYRNLVIDKIEKETEDTVSVYFKPTVADFYKYQAGKYLTVRVKVKGKTHNRCFSLSSSPADNFLRITVRLKGEVSNYFMHQAKVGDNIQSLLPVGDFIIPMQQTKPLVLIAGGSGITALYSIINNELKNNPTKNIALLYANKTVTNIIFKQQIAELQAKYPSFTCTHFISGVRKIDEAILQQHKSATFFICGPDGLKTAMQKQLKTLGVSTNDIFVENYADGYVPWFGLV
jgi:ring-1,2-phenylacetyl-CoA epoxidase subunit PaaE